MKNLFLTALLLLAFQSSALIRNSPTPQLHSILDKREAAILTAPVLMPPKPANHINTPAADRREVGIGLTTVGVIVLAAGAGIYHWAGAETQRQQANGGRSYTGIYLIGGILITIIGGILMAAGLAIWLLNAGK